MQNGSRIQQKMAVLVEISLDDGSIIFGKLFVSAQGRLTDVLNDEREFLPVENEDGTISALSKRAIRMVTLPSAKAPVYRGSDPHLILGVREGVTSEQLKKAYHQLSLVNHPDRIKGLGLGADFQELATHNMARISSAYTQILRTMKIANNTGAGAERDVSH